LLPLNAPKGKAAFIFAMNLKALLEGRADLNRYCRSYSPLDTFLKTPNPAFFASEIDAFFGELNVEKMRRTGFLHAGHWVKGAAESGRRSVNFPPHTLQLPSHSSYS